MDIKKGALVQYGHRPPDCIRYCIDVHRIESEAGQNNSTLHCSVMFDSYDCIKTIVV